MDELDEDALRRCRRGDMRGLEALFAVYKDRTYRLCLHILTQPADAEDAAQEVFLRVFDRIDRFDGRSKLSTWVHRLTVNLCLNRLAATPRGAGSLTDLLDDEVPATALPSPPESAHRREAAELARRLLARLPEADRVVLALREIEGLTYREIAGVLEVPIGTVMSRLSRARERLAQRIAPCGEARGGAGLAAERQAQ